MSKLCMMKKGRKISGRGRIAGGTKLALKYGTVNEQYKLIERYCKHISEGYSKESFRECCYKTVEKYAEDITAEMSKNAKTEKFTIFPTVLIQGALRASRYQWEKWGIQGMTNKIPFFNSNIWAINMRNRFGWDKEDKTEEMIVNRTVTVNFIRQNNTNER